MTPLSLPPLIGLCPGPHRSGCYVPLDAGGSTKCSGAWWDDPCEHELVVYVPRAVADALAAAVDLLIVTGEGDAEYEPVLRALRRYRAATGGKP